MAWLDSVLSDRWNHRLEFLDRGEVEKGCRANGPQRRPEMSVHVDRSNFRIQCRVLDGGPVGSVCRLLRWVSLCLALCVGTCPVRAQTVKLPVYNPPGGVAASVRATIPHQAQLECVYWQPLSAGGGSFQGSPLTGEDARSKGGLFFGFFDNRQFENQLTLRFTALTYGFQDLGGANVADGIAFPLPYSDVNGYNVGGGAQEWCNRLYGRLFDGPNEIALPETMKVKWEGGQLILWNPPGASGAQGVYAKYEFKEYGNGLAGGSDPAILALLQQWYDYWIFHAGSLEQAIGYDPNLPNDRVIPLLADIKRALGYDPEQEGDTVIAILDEMRDLLTDREVGQIDPPDEPSTTKADRRQAIQDKKDEAVDTDEGVGTDPISNRAAAVRTYVTERTVASTSAAGGGGPYKIKLDFDLNNPWDGFSGLGDFDVVVDLTWWVPFRGYLYLFWSLVMCIYAFRIAAANAVDFKDVEA